MSVETEDIQSIGGLCPEYKTYERQKCFVGHSREAEWHDDILSACARVLPKFGLEPWYAADHFDPTKPLRDKVVELIANARYGIYDLSSWQDAHGEWHLPRNVFIELGMAIVLNRPALLPRHTSNKALPLPLCLQGVELLEFAGETTLKKALEERLPQWFDVPPERDWLNRFCIFGNRVCSFREEQPRTGQWKHETLRCHVSDGLERERPCFQKAEREEIRGAFEDVFSRYKDLAFDYLDELSLTDGYRFLLCSHCQTVRSTPFAVYRILPHTPAEVFIAIGMSIALETLLGYDIPKVLLVRQEQDLPSLLRGYEVVEAVTSSGVKRKLRAFVPTVMQKVRETMWKPRPLPFIEVSVQACIEPVPLLEWRREVTAAMSAEPFDLERILHLVMNSLSDIFHEASCAIRLYDSTTDQFRPQIATGVMEEWIDLAPRPDGTSRYVVRNKTPLYLELEEENVAAPFDGGPGVPEHILALGIKAVACLPLISKEDVVGLLYVNLLVSHRFSQNDRQILEFFAEQAAIAIENARLFAEEKARAEQEAETTSAGTAKILYLDSDPDWQRSVGLALASPEFDLRVAASYPEARAMLEEEHFDLVITELSLATGDDYEGVMLLDDLSSSSVPCVVLTGSAVEVRGLLERYNVGEVFFKGSTLNRAEFRRVIQRALETTRTESVSLPDNLPRTLAATFGLDIEEVLSSGLLPTDAPTDYIYLCDWLEEDLRRRLQDRIGDFQYAEASKRDGETLSVRIAFEWQSQDRQPDFGDLEWWSVLELAPFEDVYPGQDASDFWDK